MRSNGKQFPRLLARIGQAGLAVLVGFAILQIPQASPVAEAAEFCAPGQVPEYVLGFAFLKTQLGSMMGEPVDCEHYDENGNAYQKTSTGDLFYDKSLNVPMFSQGERHWAWVDSRVVQWTGTSLTPPGEAATPAAPAAAVAAGPAANAPQGGQPPAVNKIAQEMVDRGRQTFRFDTFGSEVFWGDTLLLHQAINGEALGGVGPGLSPRTALGVGLKVDVDALPQSIINAIRRGTIDLDDPANTIALLQLDAVVGVKGTVEQVGGQSRLSTVAITCALCHSTVNDSLTAGIGRRLDGWANRDLNVGAVVDLSPNLQPVADLLGVDVATVHAVLQSWGPGRFDALLFLDGKAFRPDGATAATLLPPAFGLAGVNLHTWTGAWGSVPYWNAFVGNLEMHGQGTFFDPRLNDPVKYPVAARAGFFNVRHSPDLVTPKLADLQFYQLALPAPQPPAGSFDPAAAARGGALFNGTARCAECHVPPLFTEPGWNLHTAGEIGIDDFQAMRSPDGRYRTAPLKGLWTHMQGGFYHDGRFATLNDVVRHYNDVFGLGLTDQDVVDLVEYLKSL